jgi:outer membrane protein OmpA-like peptidoglycan-associated protein
MRRFVIAVTLVTFVLIACKKKEDVAAAAVPLTTTATTQSATATTSSATTTTVATSSSSTEPSLVSFSAGALIVQKPKEYNDSWSAFWILDEKPQTGWASPEGVVTPQTVVIALPERTLLDRLEFDTGDADGEHRGAKEITVEVSDIDATSGFQKIADVALQDHVNGQTFPVSAQVPGRWVRLDIKNNWGAPDYLELMDFRGYGKQLTQTPFVNVSGTYESDYGRFHLKQEGTSVTGCYEHSGGLLTGGIEGRIMKFTWTQDGPSDGPAIMVFDSSGQQMFGLWWYAGQTSGSGGAWNGKKISSEVGSCPNWSGGSGVEARMQKELEDFGRTRVYGINFDTDSDVIRAESKPTLDKIAAVMKAKPEWKLTVEGHTDASGGDAHNQQLSQKRADSVKSYLVTAGIVADRLTATGLGSSKPVAENTNASGRAQNRRVELTKQ